MEEDQLRICLQKQIDELDMLQSIFCNPGELKVNDHSVTADINEFLVNNLNELSSQLEYTIRIDINNTIVDVTFELPHLYPITDAPNVTIRSSNFNKQIESRIKQELNEFIKTLDHSEVYIYEIITWFKDNVEHLLNELKLLKKVDTDPSQFHQSITMERLWIYSHHIKSKTKRQNMIKYAREYGLSGFLRPGKPGIICVEGLLENTQEFWKIVRSWNWYKITLRKSETKAKNIDKIDTFRKFGEFREELFTDIGMEDDDKEVVMDMSLFMKFLDQHKCGYIKKDLFGFD